MTTVTSNPIAPARTRVPVAVKAIATGLAIGLPAANVWPLLLGRLGIPGAAAFEAAFLALYLWWVSGGGFPASLRGARRAAFRTRPLSRAQWSWALLGALTFAATVHAFVVILFRLVPFPVAEFRQGYHFAVPGLPFQWIAITISAASAGICEETGFRGYMQQPIEQRHGAFAAIAISSVLFTILHLTKGWAIAGMIPIVLAAGVLLGLLAWASNSLLPGIIGHTVMDIGLFAYWWTGVAGTFSAKTIAVTGVDAPFVVACAVACVALTLTLTAIVRLRVLSRA